MLATQRNADNTNPGRDLQSNLSSQCEIDDNVQEYSSSSSSNEKRERTCSQVVVRSGRALSVALQATTVVH